MKRKALAGGVGLLVLVGMLLAGGNRSATSLWADPSGIDWDVTMSDPAHVSPGQCTTNNNNGLIQAGECPDVTSTFRIESEPAGTQSFFDRASAIWLTGALGADQTGDTITDAMDGLVPNRPTQLGARTGQIHLQVQSNLAVRALLQNNIDDVALSIDSTVTGQPLPCGSTGTRLLQDDIELWNATTADSPTVFVSDTQKPDPTYPPGCDSTGRFHTTACAPKGVTNLPAPLVGLKETLGLPSQALLVSRSYGIARMPIVAGIESDIDVNVLVYRLHGSGINGYLALTLVQYPGLPSPDPTARGYSPLAQTLQTCPPYESTVTIDGVTSDADFNGDGMTDLTVTPELNRLVVPGTPSETYDYTLRASMAADYDGDTVPSYADRCDTDPAWGSAGDNDGDTLTGPCDPNGEGIGGNPKVGLWNAKPPWDTGQDVDGDGYLNYVDNCPTHPNPDQQDTDGDGVGDACDPAPTIPGNGEGYGPLPGMFVDHDYLCNDPWTVGVHEPSDDGTVTEWSDSNDDGVPDDADCDSDSDHDGLVDAVEVAAPGVQPCLPGISSYGTSTDPLDPDTDDDGHLDGSDNCPAVANPGQENADKQIGNGKGIPGHDQTVPNSPGDLEGDACETDGDADNDGYPDVQELLYPDPSCPQKTTATSPGGDVTYDDNHNGDPALGSLGGTDAADDPPSWDSDGDGVLDGAECALGTDPANPASRPTTAQCGAAGDTDGDGLQNAWETCKWGTNPALIDSDGDTKGDCVEAADVDGNGVVSFTGDVIYYAKAILLSTASFGKDGDFDIDGNNALNFTGDVIQEAKFGLLPGLCK
jgi:hypothetical protein